MATRYCRFSWRLNCERLRQKSSMNNGNVKVFYFSTARIREISQLIQLIIKKNLKFLILHFGTNDATVKDSKKILDHIFLLKSTILKSLAECRVILSKPTFRSDKDKAALTI